MIRNIIINFGKELFILMNEMSFYLLLGFLFAGILHVFFPKDKVNKYLGKNNFWSVLNAAILGIPLPLCSCGVIPTGVSFYKNGASKGSAVSFLISTPQTGVDSIMITYSLLGLPFAIIRALVALVTGLFGGILTNFSEKKNNADNKDFADEIAENHESGNKLKRLFQYGFVTFMQDLSKWLIVGILIATLIAVVLPDDFFTTYVSNQYLEMLIVLVGAIPLYVCATGSVPIAAALMGAGLSPGAALVFLMAGPATNAATITVIGKSMGRNTLIKYLISIISGALFFGFLINNFLPESWFSIMNFSDMQLNHESHEIIPKWLKITSSILLVMLIMNGYFQKYLDKKRNKNIMYNKENKIFMETIKVKVEGMSCNHCKMNVENNLSKIEGIESVSADVSSCEVEISGDNVDIQKVEELINGLGYSFKGEL